MSTVARAHLLLQLITPTPAPLPRARAPASFGLGNFARNSGAARGSICLSLALSPSPPPVHNEHNEPLRKRFPRGVGPSGSFGTGAARFFHIDEGSASRVSRKKRCISRNTYTGSGKRYKRIFGGGVSFRRGAESADEKFRRGEREKERVPAAGCGLNLYRPNVGRPRGRYVFTRFRARSASEKRPPSSLVLGIYLYAF